MNFYWISSKINGFGPTCRTYGKGAHASLKNRGKLRVIHKPHHPNFQIFDSLPCHLSYVLKITPNIHFYYPFLSSFRVTIFLYCPYINDYLGSSSTQYPLTAEVIKIILTSNYLLISKKYSLSFFWSWAFFATRWWIYKQKVFLTPYLAPKPYYQLLAL